MTVALEACPPRAEVTVRNWTKRRWIGAAVATLAIGLLLGLPTELVPNPIFARQIEAPAWAYPAWIVSSLLAGLLAATYVRQTAPQQAEATSDEVSLGRDEKQFAAGGLLALFAVGCPTCNALVVIALGANGALAFFEPVQPFLALAGIGLLGFALKRRLGAADAQTCEVSPRRASR